MDNVTEEPVGVGVNKKQESNYFNFIQREKLRKKRIVQKLCSQASLWQQGIKSINLNF